MYLGRILWQTIAEDVEQIRRKFHSTERHEAYHRYRPYNFGQFGGVRERILQQTKQKSV